MYQYDCSIVIPTFNNVGLTAQCLTALVEHTTGCQYEVVIVDNASTDDTPALLDGLDGDVQVIRNAENRGFAAACNQGARAARGKQLLFLNADTAALAGWLEPMVAALDLDPQVGIVGSRLLFPDGTLQHAGVLVVEDRRRGLPIFPIHVHYQHPADHEQANVARDLTVVTGACMLVRRECWDEMGGLDEGYWNGYEDVDLCFTARAHGWRVRYEPASCLYHHESVSGPERFRRQEANLERLTDRWAHRMTCEARLSAAGLEWSDGGCTFSAEPAEAP